MDWSGQILDWFQQNGRTYLPWRQTRDPYAICVSEFMLQQTQVDRVIPKYHAWLEVFPTWRALAEGKTAEVLRLWSGLGYNSRALRLQKLAKSVLANYQGALPADAQALLSLPGIGPYTAAALQAFAFDQEVVVIDTNIERIILRYFWAKPVADKNEVRAKCEQIMQAWNKKNSTSTTLFARYFFQALMDFGALVCKAKPQCSVCPLRDTCHAFATQQFIVKRPKQSHFAHSKRFYRGQLLKTLHKRNKLTMTQLQKEYDIQKYSWQEIVASLKKDGLVAVHEAKEIYVTLPLG